MYSRRIHADFLGVSLRYAILVAVWLACVAALIGKLQVYANTPGDAQPAPAFLTLELIDGRAELPSVPRVYLFLHERCPCSRASVEELARHTDLIESALVSVVFSGPATTTDGSSALRSLVERRIPLAFIREDPTGEMARRFGAVTSGYTVMYRPNGTLHFSGGLTPSRGHLGPSIGREAILSLTRDERAATTAAPVFGCPLFSETCDDTAYCGDPTP